MTLRTRRTFPDVVSGYALRNYRIAIVQPMAAVNVVANPSIETNTVGYIGVGGATGVRSAAWQRRGAYSLAMTPTAGVNDGVFYQTVAMSGGRLYAMSVDILAAGGVPFQLYFANTLGQRQSPKAAFVASGEAQRPVLLWQPPTTSNYRCYITKDGHASTKIFYLDGLQVELGPASTYIDGDQRGFIANQAAYYWSGTPHASTSSRILATRAGGVEMDISKFGFTLLAVLGLGLGGYVNQFTPSAFVGGSQYEGTIAIERTFDLIGALTGRSHLELANHRSDLAQLLRPNTGVLQQPLLLKVQMLDDCGDAAGEPVEIPCTFEPDGLVGQVDNDFQERVDLKFKIFLPFVARRDGEEGAALGFQGSVANANDGLYRAAAGQWTALGAGFNAQVLAMAVDLANNRVYFGGDFTTAGGTLVNRITYWDGAQFVAMADGVAGGGVNGIKVAANGDVWIVGSFTSVNGAATKGIARWNFATSTWTAFNLSTTGFVGMLAVDIAADGTVYIGGSFTDLNGTANNDNIVKYDGASWLPLGTGANGIVYAIRVAPDGKVYVGGGFTAANGVTLNRIGYWNGTTFVAMAGGTSAGGDQIRAIEIAPNGLVYMGGIFSTIGGVTAANIAYWNGVGFSAMGSGVNQEVLGIAISAAGVVYAAGNFTTAGGLTLADSLAAWNGSAWVYVDVDLPGASNGRPLLFQEQLFLGYNTSGTATAAALTTLTNSGSADAYPIYEFTGPGKLYQLTNYTTGDALYFNLTLLSGETARLDLRPGNLSFVSSFRGDISGTILPGSSFGSWHLAPGANNASAYIGGTTSGATAIAGHWAPTYLALEDALY